MHTYTVARGIPNSVSGRSKTSGYCATPATSVRKTISLPRELAREAEETARAEGKTLSGVIQDALRQTRAARLKREFKQTQRYWSRKAREKGILSEEDLRRFLSE